MSSLNTINKITFKQKMEMYKKRKGSLAVRMLVKLSALITFAVLIYIVLFILINGVGHLNAEFFSFNYTTENVSVIPAVINTLVIIVISLVISIPIGILSAVFLVEYAKRGSKIVNLIRITAETLSGIPSIVYGLFGMLFFVNTLKMGYSMISGGLTLAIMILPLIMRTTEEALISVPDTYREASFGLGAGTLRTVFRVILPASLPGILAGVILSIGRIIGESAALMYTSGTVAQIATNVMDSGRTLAIHMYLLASEGLYTDQAYATAVVLLVVAILINMSSQTISKRIIRKG
ncbi:phosphate ABC transporter permease PstA [Parasporobacterium paucivorans]|uniref:Phosphate transport system permease protein PstA n=1 Tax=Parasporobacterium paucivorans DSM 15970 TaxID=1122934 RepID=A0A1M6D711_9FIRM|nr:phosphate ABC transporter permease PstA [Parasporobacterium paucivorans]SHI69026.1 phosphate ABC transporter membrane protein 2, PhoT family (TC 3.A.1.7.1) [Parasporobacterium paucivorans DSM 15970]